MTAEPSESRGPTSTSFSAATAAPTLPDRQDASASVALRLDVPDLIRSLQLEHDDLQIRKFFERASLSARSVIDVTNEATWLRWSPASALSRPSKTPDVPDWLASTVLTFRIDVGDLAMTYNLALEMTWSDSEDLPPIGTQGRYAPQSDRAIVSKFRQASGREPQPGLGTNAATRS